MEFHKTAHSASERQPEQYWCAYSLLSMKRCHSLYCKNSDQRLKMAPGTAVHITIIQLQKFRGTQWWGTSSCLMNLAVTPRWQLLLQDGCGPRWTTLAYPTEAFLCLAILRHDSTLCSSPPSQAQSKSLMLNFRLIMGDTCASLWLTETVWVTETMGTGSGLMYTLRGWEYLNPSLGNTLMKWFPVTRPN